MLQFLIYEAKVAVVMAAFYLLFKILLSKEKMYRLNRCVLVGSFVLSFILPLCTITIHRTVPVLQPAREVAVQPLDGLPANAIFDLTSDYRWLIVVSVVYVLGIAVALLGVIIDLIRIRKLVLKGETHEDDAGCRIVILDGDMSPFSWMRHIFLSREDFVSGNKCIIEHERAHVRLGHAQELLIIEILSSMQWFNPVMWLLKSDLKSIYEYEADGEVLGSGVEIKQYQYMLLRKAVDASGCSITNGFNHGIVKKRIAMMSKPIPPGVRRLKAFYILPLLCGALACNARIVYSGESSDETTVRHRLRPSIAVRNEGGDAVYYVNGVKTAPEKLAENLNKCRPEWQHAARVSLDTSLDVSALGYFEYVVWIDAKILNLEFDNTEQSGYFSKYVSWLNSQTDYKSWSLSRQRKDNR